MALTADQKKEILQKVANGEMDLDQAMAALKPARKPGVHKPRALSCKVSKAGALSVYGLQRFPVTLYVSQWEKLLPFAGEILKFAEEHKAELKEKAGDTVSAEQMEAQTAAAEQADGESDEEYAARKAA